ncbi:MAG: methylenetetrahydrofolate reductase [Povalibacter sp.]
MQQLQSKSSDAPELEQTIVGLARDASIELNVQDLDDLDPSRAFLPAGKRIYVSHLPKQRWEETVVACQRVVTAGFDPIPHIPVRLIESEAMLDGILERMATAKVKEILLIAGDYPRAAGPYSAVADVLRAGKLHQHGFTRVSLAGHPEGHPTVPLEEIRRAEVEKAAHAAPLETTYVTQFFFEASPFLQWASDMRARGIGDARLIAGLAGPAGIATLLKFARRCGVGPSIRALVSRPSAFAKLIGEHGPEDVMRDLAVAYERDASTFSGLHFFCFGGYLRTCEWLGRYSRVSGFDRQAALR